ncbi:GldG family protein [Paenibacillus sp. UNC451MF]|uniref:GldG family protein n=1 Tax=Paenibacillus sp. UNC451MF TaxID=1449063 RepID=UPI00048D87F7|nr:GldG family protein [Paenibacillus sp. UNC451MF]
MNKWIRGTNAVVLSLAVIGIFIVLTIFLNSTKTLQVDLTQNKQYTLSEQTINTLKSLDNDVHVIAFTSSQTQPLLNREVVDMVQEYKKRSSKIIFDQFNIENHPEIANQYEGIDPSGVLVVESGSQKKMINYYDMFQSNGQSQTDYQFSGEQKLTQALVNLNVKDKSVLYFLSGHNETPLNQMTLLQSSLENENYTVKDLNLLREGKIPDDAQALFIIGAQNDLSDKETEVIKEYLKGNGKLYMSLGFNENMATAWKNLDSVMALYGVTDQHAIAVDPKQSRLVSPLTIIPEYGYHEITNKLQDYNLLMQMGLAASLNVDQPAADYQATSILKTSDSAFGKTDLAALVKGNTNKGDKDIKGPLNLGYVVQTKDNKPKAVILGSFTSLRDDFFQQQGNRDFALNSVGWLQEQKDQVTIRPRENQFQPAMITGGQAQSIFYGTVLLFPLLFLIVGGTIWWRRRKG